MDNNTVDLKSTTSIQHAVTDGPGVNARHSVNELSQTQQTSIFLPSITNNFLSPPIRTRARNKLVFEKFYASLFSFSLSLARFLPRPLLRLLPLLILLIVSREMKWKGSNRSLSIHVDSAALNYKPRESVWKYSALIFLGITWLQSAAEMNFYGFFSINVVKNILLLLQI